MAEVLNDGVTVHNASGVYDYDKVPRSFLCSVGGTSLGVFRADGKGNELFRRIFSDIELYAFRLKLCPGDQLVVQRVSEQALPKTTGGIGQFHYRRENPSHRVAALARENAMNRCPHCQAIANPLRLAGDPPYICPQCRGHSANAVLRTDILNKVRAFITAGVAGLLHEYVAFIRNSTLLLIVSLLVAFVVLLILLRWVFGRLSRLPGNDEDLPA